MKDYPSLLTEAKVYIKGIDQREEGLRLLNQIAEESPGSPSGIEAKEILIRENLSTCTSPFPEFRNAEAEAFSKKWNISSVYDARLPELLKDISNNPAVLIELKYDIVRNIREWFSLLIPDAEKLDSNKKGKLYDVILSLPGIYKEELITEVRQLTEALFRSDFEIIKTNIENACQDWNLEAAWNEFNKLKQAPETFRNAVKSLQNKIYETDEACKNFKNILDQVPAGSPQIWPDMIITSESLKKLYELRHSNTNIPEYWCNQADDKIELSKNMSLSFLKNEAHKALYPSDVKYFWEGYTSLRIKDPKGGLQPDIQWFQPFLDQCADTFGTVEDVTGDDELEHIRNRLLQDKKELPPFLRDWHEARISDLNHQLKTWRMMKAGEAFEEPDMSSLLFPRVLKQEMPSYRKYLTEIEKVSARMDKWEDTASLEKSCNEAKQVATRILEKHPDHVKANRLKHEAEHKIHQVCLEVALAEWNMDRFKELCRKSKTDERYLRLCQAEELDKLSFLAKAETFTASDKAKTWWSDWRVSVKSLSGTGYLPDALDMAIREMESTRKKDWHILLENLKTQDIEPEKCHIIVKSLENEPDELDLRAYRHIFIRKEKIERVKRFLDAGKFSDAEKEIVGLDPNDDDTRYLRTLLKIRQSQAQGLESTTSVLYNEWVSILSCLGEDETCAILMKMIREAWEKRNKQVLKKLITLADRATREISSAHGNPIQQWSTWLKIEETVMYQCSSLGIRELVHYIQAQKTSDPETLRLHLSGLVTYWKGKADMMMLTLAQEAFSHLGITIAEGIEQPSDQFAAQTLKTAEDVSGFLRNTDNIRLEDLETRARIMEKEKEKWTQLSQYLNHLDTTPNRHEMPGNFLRTLDELNSLIEIVAELRRLDDSDLREDHNSNDLMMAKGQAMELDNTVLLRKSLTEHIERLSPLTRLNYIEGQIDEQAEKCGSDKETDLREELLFDELSKRIRKMISVFENAGIRERKMWNIMSDQYCDKIYNTVGIFFEKPTPPDLGKLAENIDRLEDEEQSFRRKINKLWTDCPVASQGSFNPENHKEYLKYFPDKPPNSRRVYILFRRRILRGDLPAIVEQSRSHIPDWVQDCMKRGIP